jgi:hypothetical protein
MTDRPDQRWHDMEALCWRLVAEGVIPQPQKYRGKLKWKRADVDAWLGKNAPIRGSITNAVRQEREADAHARHA